MRIESYSMATVDPDSDWLVGDEGLEPPTPSV
jgi:hypothetical protein